MKSKSKRRKGLKAKKYNLGGYLNPNGDPTKKPGQAVAESTAVPNYTEQAFLNYAGLLPQLQTPFFRDEGTIRQTPENEPSFLQSIWEGTPLGQTEDERMAPPDQMSLLDVMAEPMKALEYYSIESNRGKLPTRAEWDLFGPSNPYDAPLTMYNYAAQLGFAKDDEAGGLSAFTGIGKIGNVVRDAFNTGDDLLRISAENISRQGQKMTQRQLTQQINRSPLVDLEEAIYNPEIYGVEAPGFGILSRNNNVHYLGQPGGRLATQLQTQHAADYGISAQDFGMRHMDSFNVTTDGNELPITRMLDPGEEKLQPYKPGSFVSGSVPQIKPLQAGGELEKFIKKDGTINLDEVARFVGTSKSISPADKFILNEAIAKMGSMGVDVLGYNEFKRSVSHYIPRMNLRVESWNSDYGVSRIFPDASNQAATNVYGDPLVPYTSEVGVIGEGNLPDAVYSDAGGELKNYMLNNTSDSGMHYNAVPGDTGSFGSHSHYRVVRREDEPEVSYFLEIQSDALSPRGKNQYDQERSIASAGNRSIGNFAYPMNPGQFSLDDMTGQLLVRGYRPMDIVQRLTTDYQGVSNMKHRLYTIISENENLFPPISSFGPLNHRTEQKATDAINALDEENFKKVFENSIEPRVIKTHASYLSPREQLGGISLLEDSFNEIAKRMNQINEKLSPESEFRNNLAESMDHTNASYDEGQAIYDEAMKGVTAENRYASMLTFKAFERVDEAYQYVDYKYQDLADFKDVVEGFISDYYRTIDYNKFLEDVQISREDMEPLVGILNEVKAINQEIQESWKNWASLRSDLGQIRRNLDIIDEAVFPVENPSYKLTPGFVNTFNTIPETIMRIKRVSGTAEFETINNGFDETMNSYPDIYGLGERYNDLMVDFEKEIKKFKDKYLPVTESNVTNPVSNIMKKRPERRIIGEALHGPHNNLYNRFPTEETSRKIQGHPAIGEDRSVNYEAVHRKYKNMEKTLKAMGYEPKLVTDKNGNTWWEVKASAGMIHGTAEYDAYFKGGRIGLKKKRSGKMRSVKC